VLVGLSIILVITTVFAYLLQLEVIGWLITRFSFMLAVALIIIFQPELRSALARLGSSKFFSFSKIERLEFTETLVSTAIQLSKKRIGALFAIQRQISLKDQLETGVVLDAEFSPELAQTIFFPKTSLHDGGMIIAQGRVAGAACVFPVTKVEMPDRSLGLRHRAAIGLTEITDAVVIIVSEESGAISLSYDGELKRNLSGDQLRDLIAEVFLPEDKKHEEQKQNENTNYIPEALDSQAGLSDSGDSDLVSH